MFAEGIRRRLIAATFVALALLGPTVPSVLAECAPFPNTATSHLDVRYAFVATVTESSRDVDPPVPGNSAFDWHLELAVNRTYLGSLPSTIVYDGWDAGCHAFRADQLVTGDRIFILVEAFHPEYAPTDPFDGDVAVYRSTPDGWQFDPELLMYGADPKVYTQTVIRASTTAAILRVVTSATLPQTDAAPTTTRSGAGTEVLPIAVFLVTLPLLVLHLQRRARSAGVTPPR
jgi:hypothetical protein